MASNVLIGAASEVKSQFSILKEVDSSNTVFKLFSKVTVGLCVISSILVATSEYLGSPITCQTSTGKVADGVFNAFCWIHGGKKIPKLLADVFKCHSYQHEESETNDTLYYQWVVFMLAINAMLFKIPHLLWKSFEGGLMKKFHSGKGLKSDLMNADGDMEEHLQTHIAYFKKLSKKSGKNIIYYAQFQTCQLLNIIMLVLNVWATNQFLPSSSQGSFISYGSDVVNYLTTDAVDPTNPGPMCLTFPTVVGCEFSTIGTGGSIQTDTGICILSQNIINEKVYLFLWFWFVLLGVASGIQMIFEIAVLSMGAVRSWLMERQFDGTDDQQMKDFVLNLGLGDWFVLHQIGKNTNEEFFHAFIKKLSSPKADSVEDSVPLITIESGNGMELKQRNQADKPE